MTSFDRYLQRIIDRGSREAHEDGSAAIEAHHLLLAIAAEVEPATGELLSSAGLDRQAVRAALDREFEHSLSAAGVSAGAFDLPRPSPAAKPPTQLAASSKLALERMARAFRKKDLRPAHLLLGILQAEAGTVPRALALAGVDRGDLTVRVRHLIASEGA
ncbi:Clp protease N-terminal domain-containing protein [Nonomuraea muscovyensis]|uniref:D-alanyl-D-alanine carboxypeptidase n=1 Tax=Nonomuraea muscovyensis TaxID=1124761 RepID=A0A7X0C4R4_9ACTN|nr:Clp protease N-terminal domain-containing protein [Nonomuraea muscovyensis]MBB6347626.1 D-alanyl-D-alanine carboxypeptidase [Nonomuraea muscovyensis]MDF2712566.1 beta-lactamase [Nonomuraea muscovyensis]